MLEGSELTSCRITYRKSVIVVGEEKEAIEGGLQLKYVVVKSGHMVELVDANGYPCPVIQREDVNTAFIVAAEEGEGGLAAMVDEEEVIGGGGMADRAAAQEGFGR